MKYPIPKEALDDRLAWIGTSGSGKTYNAGTAVEHLLSSQAKVVIVDPLGVWWGLRLTPNGKPGFSLPIFGGEHGDLPLSESSGKIIGETVASMRESCIVDLSALQTKEAERRFMLAFLEALYRNAGGDSMHAIFDEADLWAPQNPSKTGAGPQLQSLMEQIVRRGRVRGFIPWLITQRPAVISKDVLSQVDGLVAFKLTSSQDRGAIGAWVKGQADEGQWPTLEAQLPTLQRGTGLIWLPARGVLKTADFPTKDTFDSSRTPKRGEKREQHNLRPLDLEGLKDRLSSIEAEAKANEPKALKTEIARLKVKVAALEHDVTRQMKIANEHVNEVERLKKEGGGASKDEIEEARADGQRVGISIGISRAQQALAALRMDEPVKHSGSVCESAQSRQLKPKLVEIKADGSVPAGCAKPLAALAGVFPGGMTEAQWATAAGYKRSGGTWGTYKSRLKAAAMIEQREGKWFATQSGAEAVGDVEVPPSPGPDLVRWWSGKLPGVSKIAEVLIMAWPEAIAKERLADDVGMSASGGSFGTYLSRLASPGLITRADGMIRLSDEVMGQ